jgi:hypothetical protein
MLSLSHSLSLSLLLARCVSLCAMRRQSVSFFSLLFGFGCFLFFFLFYINVFEDGFSSSGGLNCFAIFGSMKVFCTFFPSSAKDY